MFTSDRREKQGWATDYPGADLNFSTRLAELTKIRVKMTHDGEDIVPDAVVVDLTDDALFQCPFAMMEDAGTASFTEPEVARLRQYLLKGGFLLATDYHGDWAREQFDQEIGRALPPDEFPIVDLRRRTIRSGTRCSRWRRCRRWRRSTPGAAPAEGRSNAGMWMAHRLTPGASPMRTAG